MVDQHIIVHDDQQAEGVLSAPNWYRSRNGAPVYVQTKTYDDNSEGMQVAGGLQMWLNNDANAANDELCTVLKGFDQTGRETGYGNGMSYIIDRPMQPSIRSVYRVMGENSDWSKFFAMCNDSRIEDLAANVGFNLAKPDSAMATADWNRERTKYLVFRPEDQRNQFYTPNNEKLVRFFNNYHYTIYLPTNDAIDDAISHGLPTWDDIENFAMEITPLTEQINAMGELEEDDPRREEYDVLIAQRWEKMQRGQAMMTCLLNFLRYHFQGKSIFVDNVSNSDAYQTSCIDSETNNYLMLNVSQTSGNMSVTDNSGSSVSVDVSSPSTHNVLANDIQYNMRNNQNTRAYLGHIKVNSYVVLHQLQTGKYLNFVSNSEWSRSGGRFDSSWNTVESARRFVNKYRIRK